jgi:hypothetical protein
MYMLHVHPVNGDNETIVHLLDFVFYMHHTSFIPRHQSHNGNPNLLMMRWVAGRLHQKCGAIGRRVIT